ncbi:MAG: hypothetical protein WCF44_20885 [Candidatus Methylophosphatis roskildensis]
MLKPYFVVAAALSAFVVPALGVQLAVAAQPAAGLLAPAVKPNVTPTPVPTVSASTEDRMDEETMPGMDHDQPADQDDETMPGMDHDQPADMDDETMPGMDHDQPADMDDETMPGMEHGEAPESNDHGVEPVSEPRPVAALVGAFAVVNGGVMILAAVLRRRDKRRANSSPKPAHLAK